MSARCRNGGGPAPCIDDLCHSSEQTLCGLWHGIDFDIDEFEDWAEEFDDALPEGNNQ